MGRNLFFMMIVLCVWVVSPARAQLLTGTEESASTVVSTPDAVPSAPPEAAAIPTTPRPRQNNTQNKDPVEITADGSLEWRRAEKEFIARKNAKAKQAEAAIEAATLTALYRESAKSNMDVYRLNADSAVVITSRDSRAYGDNAVYDIEAGLATMTGANLKMVAPNQTVTARDKFEYRVHAGELRAIGRARMTQTDAGGRVQTLDADTITATLGNDSAGKRSLKTLQARGNVVITTPTEVLKGAYAIYNARTKTADINGGVTITRGQNILQGARAEVDLNTNNSKLFGAQGGNNTGGGRVRGVFYPEN